MTEQEQRIAIAEVCGWERTEYQSASLQIRADVPFWTDGRRYCQAEHLPDYLHDLNAMHTAVDEHITGSDAETEQAYIKHLKAIIDRSADDESLLIYEYEVAITEATADQRAEAFLKALGKWRDEETK